MEKDKTRKIRPRILVSIQIYNGRVVKTRNFLEPFYVGNPLQVVKMFNQLNVDELIIIDIGASRLEYSPDMDLLKGLAMNSSVPMTFGGGLDIDTSRKVFSKGYEKILVNRDFWKNPSRYKPLISSFGSQAFSVGIDFSTRYKSIEPDRNFFSKLQVHNLVEIAQDVGVGEIFVTDVDREGTREELDFDFFQEISCLTRLPVVANGGISDWGEIQKIMGSAKFDLTLGAAAVSLSDKDSVLVSYPTHLSQRFEQNCQSEKPSLDPARSPLQPMSIISQTRTSWIQGESCSKCLVTESVPGSLLDSSDICFYCQMHDLLEKQFPIDELSESRFIEWAEDLKRTNRSRPYDCVLGVSGGVDSSFLLHKLVQVGIRPLAVHFDNTWNSSNATSNIHKLCTALGVDLYTYVVDHQEYDDIYRSFFLAGVGDLDTPTDIGFATTLYRVARKYGIRDIVEGHSFRTEGIAPIGWLYMDGRYIRSIHKSFGRLPMKTFPNLTFPKFIFYNVVAGLKRHRPLYFLDYKKTQAKDLLSAKYGWSWYGGHHLENEFTAFYHSYFLPRVYGIDYRIIELSGLVRSKYITKEQAKIELSKPRSYAKSDLDFLLNRLGWSEKVFEGILADRTKSFRDYRTYKPYFELLRPFFWLMWKLDRIPYSFYRKYCFPLT